MKGMSIIKQIGILFLWICDRKPIELMGLSAEEKREGRGEKMSSIAGMMSQQVASIQKTLNISLLNSQLATNTAQAMVMLDQVQQQPQAVQPKDSDATFIDVRV